MNEIINEVTLATRRDQFKPGTRVELIKMSDPYIKLQTGERGHVSEVDSIGTVFVNWDSGILLGCCYNIDEIRKLSNSEVIKEQVFAITKTGRTDMMDYTKVLDIGKELGFIEICDLIVTNNKQYLTLILTGEFDSSESIID